MEKTTAKSKKTTIYDIAAEVGTSAATVSRVLSKSGYPVKDELSRKIFETADRLNYSTNMVGRMLKKSESRDIGVIIPTISNPYYPQVVLGIELEARSRGFNILLCNSFRDAAIEKRYIESIYQKQIRGLIIDAVDENHTFLKKMQENGIRIVTLDQGDKDLKCGKIGFNYIQSGLIAVEYLFKMGHKNIAFITSPLTRRSRRETLEGYKLAFLKKNLTIKEENILVAQIEEESHIGTYEFENGRLMAKRLLELPERPTAVFAVNDMTAFGIIQELINSGVKVPEDISVIGFDNIEVASMINPPLTTVNQPSLETGRLACKLLLDSMENKEAGDLSITLEPTLVERNSVLNLATGVI